MNMKNFKRVSLVAFAALAVAVSSATAAVTDYKATVTQAIDQVRLSELPAKATGLVAGVDEAQRTDMALATVEVILTKRPAIAVALVASLAKQLPESAAKIAGKAATLSPKQAVAIARTAALVAPKQAADIASAVSAATPNWAVNVAEAVTDVVPGVQTQVNASVAKVVPQAQPRLRLGSAAGGGGELPPPAFFVPQIILQPLTHLNGTHVIPGEQAPANQNASITEGADILHPYAR